MKSILVFDNYDSFTYNLVHLIKKLGYHQLEIHRNNKIKLDEINRFDKILFSPGPGIPSEAGIMLDSIKKYAATKSILGVCLGHQAIAEAFGGKLFNMPKVYHGVATSIKVLNTKDILFRNVPEIFEAGRYHSWTVVNELPDSLEAIAFDEENNIMALRHRTYDIHGVQFHPESVLTEYGEQIILNWLNN